MDTTGDMGSLLDEVAAWIGDDPDAGCQAELEELARQARAGDQAALADLRDRFAGPLQFGTAGLRGAMQAGPARMNRAVVIRAAAGLAGYLLSEVEAPKVVIGYDARHNSRTFATDSAAVFQAAGLDVTLAPQPIPTPLLAFAVRHVGADAGVMVTASHNPAADNGYKVYLGGRIVTDAGQGAQIVPPYDAHIAANIAAVGKVADVRRAASGWATLDDRVTDAYIDAVSALAGTLAAPLRVVHTAMHGVGGALSTALFAAAGGSEETPDAVPGVLGSGMLTVHEVAEQYYPNPDFPTVPFPNPEEKDAIDLALAKAREVDADLVIAHDPDADRCAVAICDPRGPKATGGWRMLHGDELGSLLGSAVVADATDKGIADAVVANSVVSSRLLGRIAQAAGLRHAVTLTGFKWISRVPGEVFGYEEAIGYCVAPDLVRDKDGLSAGMVVLRLAAQLKAAGGTLAGALDELARRHGLYLTDQLAGRYTDLEQIPAAMARLRSAPPASLGGSPVVAVRDLADGLDGLPPTDGLWLSAQDDTRVIVRPSGTEPKVKCYLEVVVPLEPGASDQEVSEARARARAQLDAVRVDMAAALGL